MKNTLACKPGGQRADLLLRTAGNDLVGAIVMGQFNFLKVSKLGLKRLNSAALYRSWVAGVSGNRLMT